MYHNSRRYLRIGSKKKCEDQQPNSIKSIILLFFQIVCIYLCTQRFAFPNVAIIHTYLKDKVF